MGLYWYKHSYTIVRSQFFLYDCGIQLVSYIPISSFNQKKEEKKKKKNKTKPMYFL